MDDVRVAEMAEGMRALLAAIAAGKLTWPPASRHQMEGAVVAREALAARPQTSSSRQPSE